jgi:soluble lytic murein transglycosylase-like protein
MKIDFNQNYKTLSKLIYRKEQPTVPSLKQEFENVLGQSARLNPNKIEPNIIKEIPKVDQNNQINIIKPQLELPKNIERISLEIDDLSEIEEGSGVKTPTVISARRIDVQNEYQPSEAKSAKIAEFKGMIEEAGKELGLDPALGVAVAHAESSFNHLAVSSDGHYSKGLFQLLDKTGELMMSRLNKNSKYDPFNPELNVELGVGYLRYLHEIFGKETDLPNNSKTIPAANSASLEKIAVAAFNAGEGRVASAQSRALKAGKDPSQYEEISDYLPEITQKYVEKVSTLRAQVNPINIADFQS